ncbi:prenyltransferase/squalene oxidase repeat-containing protein [Micromonospora chokoriensis]|uniref:Prenyltransferase and squalene oxidase repeat-containing protein n=1 Tax=Micromonospora chokoriensis TaxID=356851 RepID=A0A1C4X9B2_9ACTN|nr:prenyltransferase/squalene oxidase repeat-containing protein [Micromonospora chokoriensis]SCF05090.1 Prenyltransferase and squalene oxidase repeat-containing protein [Micromonospora chokoriensis]
MSPLVSRTSRVPAAWLAAVAAAVLGAVALVVPTRAALADPLESCTPTQGAIVAVDFGAWGGPLLRGCDATPTTGLDLLHEAGFTTTGTAHDGPGFICRIGSPDFASGAEHPTPADEACQLTPPASAYWSYWIAPAGQDHWTYSPLGAMAQRPGPGEVEAWVFGGTDIGGTTGAPTFTPASVRASGPPPSATPTPTPTATDGPTEPARPTEAQVKAVATYLVGQLTDGDHVDNGGADHYRSIAVATALAATGGQDQALTKMVDYLRAHVDAAIFPNGDTAAPHTANVANLALLATITGGDPRAFGGRNLVATLTDRVCAVTDVDAGCAAAGDFAGSTGPMTHATALLALKRAGVTPPAPTVARLTEQQCASGAFGGLWLAPAEFCDPDIAATTLAVLALHALGGQDEALGSAKAFLAGAQETDGGYQPYTGAGLTDTYSTGHAAQALAVLGVTDRAAAATGFLVGRIATGGGLSPDPSNPDADLAATGAAALALAGTNLAALTHRLGGPPPAGFRPDLAKGVSYLVAPANLIDGRYYESFPGYPDFGLTIDGAYALAATGGDDAKLRAIVEFLRGGGAVGDNGFTVDMWLGVGTDYAVGGAIGKVALLAQATGYDPRSFGGHDLIAALGDVTCAKVDAQTGCAGAGNYRYATSVFGQSLGIIAQLRAGQGEAAAKPVEFLRGLQRADGSFPSLIPAADTDRDVDSTAMAAMALAALADDPAAVTAVDKALAWIASTQKEHGGFPGAAGDSTNSTALAIQGLTLRGSSYAAQVDKALAFLASQQNDDGGFTVAAGGQAGSDVRASTQVVSGATGISFAALTRDVHDAPGPDPSGSPTPTPTPSASQPSSSTATPGATPSTTGPRGHSWGSLPRTGVSIMTIALLALVLVIGGVLLLVAARRRAVSDAGGGS